MLKTRAVYMENDELEKKSDKKWEKRLAGIIVGFILLYLIIGILLTIVLTVDPPMGERGLNYHFDFGNGKPVLTSDSEILIPALVDERNNLVFSERELGSICISQNSGDPDEYSYPCLISYKTLPEGTMIAIRPLNVTDPRYFSIDFSQQVFHGETFRLSPIIKNESQFMLNLFTVPVYIRNTTFSPHGSEGIDSVSLGLGVCGYDPDHPFVCKGYSSRPNQRYQITQGAMQVIVNEYGEYNGYHECINPLTWPEFFLSPEKC